MNTAFQERFIGPKALINSRHLKFRLESMHSYFQLSVIPLRNPQPSMWYL